ncbi:hypothetical protein F7Q99_05435 [Streptomyces kaniharaensis]|uniref:Lipoprotein n=1 Tax=Streptomyces kaniharaensis TaxID=212423 RepID=A0A6N7KLU7_9ACTN|nr:hypothetical protein [Streptomyces kaniharaensis]MQS11745.1 hypothetical protein [Streptomyces kaniharaensis]
MRTTRLVTVTSAALLCLGALSACGPENGGDQDASKTTAPTAAPATPTGGATASPSGAPAPTGGQGKPTGGGIPEKAWMSSHDIPLDDTTHWAPLAANAKPITGPVTFKGMELCHAAVSNTSLPLFIGQAAGKALVGFGGDHWQAQETLLYLGDGAKSSGTQQAIGMVRTTVTDAVKNCAKTAPGATVKVSGADDNFADFAATVTIPQADGSTVTLHEYVLDAGGTVGELSVFVTTKSGAQPKEAWTHPDSEDRYVFNTLRAPVCEAFPGC